MHKPRYVVLCENGGWQIKNAHHHLAASYASKAKALSAAIELAETDGRRGDAPEVLVRHEDERFIIEWAYGKDLKLDEAARPAGRKQTGRGGA
jgi:hypothetical protein